MPDDADNKDHAGDAVGTEAEGMSEEMKKEFEAFKEVGEPEDADTGAESKLGTVSDEQEEAEPEEAEKETEVSLAKLQADNQKLQSDLNNLAQRYDSSSAEGKRLARELEDLRTQSAAIATQQAGMATAPSYPTETQIAEAEMAAVTADDLVRVQQMRDARSVGLGSDRMTAITRAQAENHALWEDVRRDLGSVIDDDAFQQEAKRIWLASPHMQTRGESGRAAAFYRAFVNRANRGENREAPAPRQTSGEGESDFPRSRARASSSDTSLEFTERERRENAKWGLDKNVEKRIAQEMANDTFHRRIGGW